MGTRPGRVWSSCVFRCAIALASDANLFCVAAVKRVFLFPAASGMAAGERLAGMPAHTQGRREAREETALSQIQHLRK